MTATQHVLYRMRDQTGRLLYVGVTLNPLARMNQHRVTKDWWADVVRIDLTHFPTEGDMLEAEERAIRSERPLHNVIFNRGPERDQRVASDSPLMRLRNVRMSDDLWTDVQALAAVRDVRTADLVRDTLESLVRRNRKVIDEHKAAHDAPPPTPDPTTRAARPRAT